jgi:hypothetical protein
MLLDGLAGGKPVAWRDPVDHFIRE